jgi:hypothetical protein
MTGNRLCLNVHGDKLCAEPKGHKRGCVFRSGWTVARKLEEKWAEERALRFRLMEAIDRDSAA